jgi:hypothetical protein
LRTKRRKKRHEKRRE